MSMERFRKKYFTEVPEGTSYPSDEELPEKIIVENKQDMKTIFYALSNYYDDDTDVTYLYEDFFKALIQNRLITGILDHPEDLDKTVRLYVGLVKDYKEEVKEKRRKELDGLA